MSTMRGHPGVGRSTTQAVVVSSVLIIFSDSDQPVNDRHLWALARSFHVNLNKPSRSLIWLSSIPSCPFSFEHVSIGFDGHSVLLNISFQARSGENASFSDPPAVEKHLLELANGLLPPDAGRVKLFRSGINTLSRLTCSPLRAHIGMVFQEWALFDSLYVGDNVAYRLQEEHVNEEEAHRRVVEAPQVRRARAGHRQVPAELSGGMRRRVSIARAIITNPDLSSTTRPPAASTPSPPPPSLSWS